MRHRLVPAWLQVALASLLFIASQANLAYLLLPLQPSIFSLQLTFVPETFWSILNAWGNAGLASYRSHFAFDMVHPFIYGAFGYLLVSRTALFPVAQPGPRRFFQLALPLAGSFDLLENFSQLYLLNLPTGTPSWLIPFSASCSSIKWGLALVFAVAVARKTGLWLLALHQRQ